MILKRKMNLKHETDDPEYNPGLSMIEKTIEGDPLMNNVKLSQFNIFVKDYPQTGCHLIYNTLSRALVEIDDPGLSRLYSLMESPMEKPTFESLQKCDIIIDDKGDESISFNKLLKTQTSRTDEFNLTLLTTYECPMRCIYCYQGRIKEKKSMSSEVTMDTDGGIYTCPAFLGIDEYRIGSIYEHNAMDYQNNMGYNLSFEFADECKNCPYIPICTGGCRYNTLVEQGDITTINCQREYFSYSLPLLLKTHYSLRYRYVKSPDAN